SAAQLGFEDVKEKQVNKPLKGHFAKTKVTPKKYLVEVPVEDSEELKVGDTVKADIFTVGDMADVIGISKGKGFTGVVKRWGFKGGPASHGSHSHRAPGSIGACSTPSRVHKGKKMPGRAGNERVTVQNLEVVKVVPEENLILVKGSVPGARGGLLLIRNAVKGKK
ncbi:MAG: 50S ribosomal protein L3, partial [Candidatus Subteraquimicrobiales bacterium]|nr:50S ribosomal protein L3 [Candidatus Subteraquimicrobiales bacterium]